MSFSSLTSYNRHVASGSTPIFAYQFYIPTEDDLLVTVADTDGVETVLTLDTDYTVDGVGESEGGNVTLVDANQAWLDADGDLIISYVIVIRRVASLIQETDIRNQGSFFPETHEDALDYLTFLAQQLDYALRKAPKFRETSTTRDLDFPEPEANTLVGWNDDGTELQNYEQGAAELSAYTPPSGAFADDDEVQSVIDTLNPRIHGSIASPNDLVAGTALNPDDDVLEQSWFVRGSGGAVDVSANPQIVAGTAVGQKLRLIGTHATQTVKYENGTGLVLNGDCVLKAGSILGLWWAGASYGWTEDYRNDI